MTRAAKRRLRFEQRLLIVGVLAAVLAVSFALWRVNQRGNAKPGQLGNDPGVSHVHGLGIDPADGTLYVATHFGTFRIASRGRAERVGGSYQDTMGFTVAGANDFLGSGHPDLQGARAGQPRLLGLIESRDGGDTWTSLSLAGAADLHALAYAHDHVYAWDVASRQFMVSSDRATWDRRATVDLNGFAVDPADADHIVATGPDGLLDSHDGGRTWPKIGGPPLTVISWDPTTGAWGADATGDVWHSTDNASTWTSAGTLPGEPEALLATPDTLYAAAGHDRTGVYQSSDGGRTWLLRYQDP